MMILGFAGIGFMAYRRKSKPGIDGRLIDDHQGLMESRLRAAFWLRDA
jgi:hypothetical protein